MGKKDNAKEEIFNKMGLLLGKLTEEQYRTTTAMVSLRQCKKGETIYSCGEMPQYMYCLLEGKVKVYKYGIGNRCQIVRVMKPVEYFGYRAYFSNGCFVTTAETLEPSLLAMIPLTAIKHLILTNASLGWFFVQQLCDELGRSDQRTVNLTQKHIRGRLAETLLALKDRYGLEADGYTLSIYLSREDLANLSNMTTSNAIRTLSLFAADGIIAVDGRKIKIINEEQLMQISKLG